MALEKMLEVLRERLDVEKARDSQKAIWQAFWNEAQKESGKPIPCPFCFVHTNQVNRIIPLPNEGKVARGRCEVCRNEYRWPDADA
ncbi:C4-type Zn-finger protein [Variovorax boronicumulans]|uniref:hypothetical protein n=1 Tax=Variovorax boronicumulans TaxID=436515 RepID=UPI00278099F5|nr:hypothetical protein [Variovorax boronicumulans]MDQ0038932.1 C4-type Zn-finger protein [Variovorax boronicumulans]